MSEQLRDCPFCGTAGGTGDGMIQVFRPMQTASGKREYVTCGECGTRGPYGEGSRNARDLWNRRAAALTESRAEGDASRDAAVEEALAAMEKNGRLAHVTIEVVEVIGQGLSKIVAERDGARAEVERLREELKPFQPMTVAEAEAEIAAFDSAESVPMSDEQIALMVKFATGTDLERAEMTAERYRKAFKAECVLREVAEAERDWLAAELRQVEAERDLCRRYQIAHEPGGWQIRSIWSARAPYPSADEAWAEFLDFVRTNYPGPDAVAGLPPAPRPEASGEGGGA